MVLTANEEVQTNEEAQENVRDLNLFVTVQILEETPAVLSLGKLCEEHGYTCDWTSGQKPYLTTKGKTENVVPVVVPGLSSSSSSSSSSTSFPQDQGPLRVQQDYVVTILTLKHRETEAIFQKKKKEYKSGQHSSNEKSFARSS